MNISLRSIKDSLASFFERYHFMVFFVLIMISMSYIVIQTYMITTSSDDAGDYTSKSNNTNFDKDTVQRLRELKTSDQETERLPFSGRISPF